MFPSIISPSKFQERAFWKISRCHFTFSLCHIFSYTACDFADLSVICFAISNCYCVVELVVVFFLINQCVCVDCYV